MRISGTAGAFVEKLVSGLAGAADPRRAGPMAAYMKTTQPFLGVSAKDRDALMKGLRKRHPLGSAEEYEAVVLALWTRPHREERYLAISVAKHYQAFVTPERLGLYERMIREGAWWDLVDDIAVHLVGALQLAHRQAIRPIMDRWIEDPDLWIRRSAILSQLQHRDATDARQLFAYCEKTMHEKEFFIRKAIGWTLREYAKSNPAAVRAFLRKNANGLSGLSIREASKHLG